MVFEEQALEGLYVIIPKVHEDQRGYFFESFKKSEFRETLSNGGINSLINLITKKLKI